MAKFGPSMEEMCLDNTFRSFLELVFSRLVQSNPDFIILKAQNSKSHAFGIFERVQTPPQNKSTLFIFGDTRIPKQIKTNPCNLFETYYFCKSRNQNCRTCSKLFAPWFTVAFFSCLFGILSTSFLL